MEFDTVYKFVATSFAIAYFIGLIIGIIIVSLHLGNSQETDITESFYLTGQISFRDLFTETTDSSLKLAILPFSYLIIGIKNGFSHASYILSPFLGQIKLAVLLIPEIFYFIAYIIFSVLGLKIIATFVLFIVTRYLIKDQKIIKTRLFKKEDILFLFIGLLAITIGTFIQIYLSRIFFIFLINFQLITYILIVLIYAATISVSFYILYQIIKSAININTKF